MKTKLVLLLSVIFLASSCKKIKKPSGCIDGPTAVDVGESVNYTWCGDKADEIEWSANNGESGSGNSFTTTFSTRNRFTIIARGKNKFRNGDETILDVVCGKQSYVWCSISDQCTNGNVIYNTSDLVNYKGYLYNSKSDWAEDVDNVNHNKCIDSVTAIYSSDKGSAGVYFKKTLPNSSLAFVSIEYRNPQTPTKLLTNWGELMVNGSGGLINADNREFQDNSGYTNLTDVAKKILRGKWKLTGTEINGSPITTSQCNLDDYVKFYANGTWKYFIGTDNCNGSSAESNGDYTGSSIQSCSNNGSTSLNLSTTSGPFTGLNGAYFTDSFTKLRINFTQGSTNGTVIFAKTQ